MNNPLVSIITPTYNSAHFIVDAIESVLAQTYENWEMVITDDGSEDDTVAVVKGYMAKDERISLYENNQNAGPGVTRNNSITQSKGRFIAFLDSDDFWEPNKLEVQIKFMLDNDIDFSFTSYRAIDENSGEDKYMVIAKETVDRSDMLKTCFIGCSTAIYDTTRLGKVLMPKTRKRQDYGLWFLLVEKCKVAYGLNQVLGSYRIRRDSVSSSKFRLVKYQWRLYRDVFRLSYLGALRSMFYLVYYALSGRRIKGR